VGKRKRADRDGGSERERGEEKERKREREERHTGGREGKCVCERGETHRRERGEENEREREREKSSTQNATLLAKTHIMPPCSLRSER